MENLVKENKAFDAAEFYVKDWVDENGNTTNQIKLSDFNPNSAIEKKEYFSILISNCVAVEKNKR